MRILVCYIDADSVNHHTFADVKNFSEQAIREVHTRILIKYPEFKAIAFTSVTKLEG